MRPPALPLAFALALALPSSGCSQLLGVDYRVGEHAGSGSGGESPDGSGPAPAIDYDVGCLGSVSWPAPSADAIVFNLSLVTANTTASRPVGLTYRPCYDALPDCLSPGLPEQPVGSQFTFSAREPLAKDRFFDHLAVRDPGRKYFDYLLYFFPFPGSNAGAQASVWKRSELRLALGIDPDPRLGTITFDAQDCNSAAASLVPGVSVSLDKDATAAGLPPPTFFYGYPPVADPTGHTDGNGLVYITDVAPGIRTVDAMHDGRRFGTVKIRVEADHITAFHFVPTP